MDEIFRNRWRTLLSVDDMVDNIMTFLRENDMLENTVAMFTSDHGYHLGTFGLPLDKRMPYETDIRYIIIEFAFWVLFRNIMKFGASTESHIT